MFVNKAKICIRLNWQNKYVIESLNWSLIDLYFLSSVKFDHGSHDIVKNKNGWNTIFKGEAWTMQISNVVKQWWSFRPARTDKSEASPKEIIHRVKPELTHLQRKWCFTYVFWKASEVMVKSWPYKYLAQVNKGDDLRRVGPGFKVTPALIRPI